MPKEGFHTLTLIFINCLRREKKTAAAYKPFSIKLTYCHFFAVYICYSVYSMKYLSKKNQAALLTILLLTILFFGLVSIFLLFSEKENMFKRTQGVKTIKSSCREVSVNNQANFKNVKASKRIYKITQLMNTPIDWLFKDIENNIIDLYCLRGEKILVINFWASWCPPCIEELPSLSLLAENNKDKIFVVAISAEPTQTIKNFLAQSFSDLSPHLKIAQVDEKDKQQLFPEDSLPVTYIFNKQGILKIKELGARKWSEENLVQQIISLP